MSSHRLSSMGPQGAHVNGSLRVHARKESTAQRRCRSSSRPGRLFGSGHKASTLRCRAWVDPCPSAVRPIRSEAAMTVYIALLRAVNVGGTGKLPMERLVELCTEAGFTEARTYIASGNAIFRSEASERDVRHALEAQLHAYAGKPVDVLVRSADEIAHVVADNPFPDKPGNRVIALFTDAPLPRHPLEGAAGVQNEEVRLGKRELFVFYPDGMARTRLRLPSGRTGTARNMNTVAKLTDLAAKLGQSGGA